MMLITFYNWNFGEWAIHFILVIFAYVNYAWAPPPFDVIHPRAYEGIAQRRRKTNQKPDKA